MNKWAIKQCKWATIMIDVLHDILWCYPILSVIEVIGIAYCSWGFSYSVMHSIVSELLWGQFALNVCVHARICVYACVCIGACECVCAYVCVYVCTYTYTYMSVHVYICTLRGCMYDKYIIPILSHVFMYVHNCTYNVYCLFYCMYIHRCIGTVYSQILVELSDDVHHWYWTIPTSLSGWKRFVLIIRQKLFLYNYMDGLYWKLIYDKCHLKYCFNFQVCISSIASADMHFLSTVVWLKSHK